MMKHSSALIAVVALIIVSLVMIISGAVVQQSIAQDLFGTAANGADPLGFLQTAISKQQTSNILFGLGGAIGGTTVIGAIIYFVLQKQKRI